MQSEQESAKQTRKENLVDPSIQCLFSKKPCKRKRLKGFDFCHKHILEDKNSPFQQCSFIIKSSNERCTNPAPKSIQKKTFCLIHTRDPKLKKAHDEIMRRNQKRKLASRKAAMEQRKGSTDASTSTDRLSCETKKSRVEESEFSAAPEMDGIYKLQENGGKKFEAVWLDENDSDAESVDSEEEDPLKHAGIWTVEEALKMCRDKMIRKRSLYLEQYRRLTLLLKERKRKHLLRMSAVYQSNLNDTDDDSNEPSERLPASEIRALCFYQHINGTESLLEKQAREKRSRGIGMKTVPMNRCHHMDSNERCQSRVLPFTKYCSKRIFSISLDPDQKLYRKCTFKIDETLSCESPVAQVSRGTTCQLHALLLPRVSSEGLENILHPEERKTHSPADEGEWDTIEASGKCDGKELTVQKEESTAFPEISENLTVTVKKEGPLGMNKVDDANRFESDVTSDSKKCKEYKNNVTQMENKEQTASLEGPFLQPCLSGGEQNDKKVDESNQLQKIEENGKKEMDNKTDLEGTDDNIEKEKKGKVNEQSAEMSTGSNRDFAIVPSKTGEEKTDLDSRSVGDLSGNSGKTGVCNNDNSKAGEVGNDASNVD
eukprot:gene3232-3712_t